MNHNKAEFLTWTVAGDGKIIDLSHRLAELIGEKRDNIIGSGARQFLGISGEASAQEFWDELQGMSFGERTLNADLLTESGRRVPVTSCWILVSDREEGDGRYRVFFQPLSQDKMVERFRSLFQHNPNAVYLHDLEDRLIMANEVLEKQTGYTNRELMELGFESLIPPEEHTRIREMFDRARNGEQLTYELKGLRKDGSEIDVRVHKFPVYIDGEIDGVFGVAEDITGEKQAVRDLKESEERWQRLLENTPQPVQIVQDDKIIFINEAGARFYGVEQAEDLIGRSIMDVAHPDYMEQILERKRRLEGQERIGPGEMPVVRLDGEERYIEVHSVPIQINGKVAIQTVIHDITDRKRETDSIRSSLREKEILLKEIHHRIKNNLAVVSGMLELQMMHVENEENLELLRQSKLRIRAMAMIHEKIYQTHALSRVTFDKYLNDLVETIHKTYHMADRRIRIDYRMESVALEIEKAVPAALIINELVTNAFEHAFNGLESGKIQVFLNYDDQEQRVEVGVSDNGVGLGEEFEINSRKTLGMTLVKTLVTQLRGELRVGTGLEGEGTSVRYKFTRR